MSQSSAQTPAPSGDWLRTVLADAGIGVIGIDASGHILHANEAFSRWCAATRLTDCCEDLSPQRLALLMRPGHRPQELTLRKRSGAPQRVELMVSRPPDQPLTFLLMRPLDDRDRGAAIEGLQRDILEAVATGQPLRAVMDLLCRQVEMLAPEVICSVLTVDAQGRLHPLAAPSLPASYSDALEGWPIGPSVGSCGTAAWRGTPVEVVDIPGDPLWADFVEIAAAHGLAACWSTPIKIGADHRVVATFALYYREPRSAAPFHRRMVEACTHLCQIAFLHDRHQHEIERLAYFDGVTELPNRGLLADRARQVLLLAGRSETPAALLLLDMDRFKTVNDSMGHAVGDEVLRQVSGRLLGALRDSDTLARLGGDEFVALLPGCTAQDAMNVADKLRDALQAPLTLPGQAGRLPMTASIGVCGYPEDGRDLDQLLMNADIAMYEAKRSGRDCARFFHPSMNQALDERLAMEDALRRALSSQQFSLHFQPKLRLLDQRLVGAEALLRWHHPDQGWIPPDRFIPVAEESGLIGAIDSWVMARACAQLAAWRDAGIDVPGVSVNVSPLRFQHENVATDLRTQLQRFSLSAGDLTLEVTERLMLDDDSRVRDQLQHLHAMGVGISVDDFGTGYSSLSYLKRLPVTELKLDKSFVRDLEHDTDDRALSSAVISIGRALGLSVVAEGVETDGQRQVLLGLGCDVAQGWLFGRPLPPDEFVAWVRQRGMDSSGVAA